MLVEILFWTFSAVLVGAAFGVILSRNPVHSVLYLVLCFFNAAVLWLLIQAEFLAIVLVLVYVGAVMVLFLFVVMMLDINIEQLREGFARNAPLGALIALIMVVELAYVLWVRRLGIELPGAAAAGRGRGEQHGRDRRGPLHRVRLSVPACGDRAPDRDRRGHHADDAPPPGPQGPGHREPGRRESRRPRASRQHAVGARAMIGLAHYLLLAGILFSIAVAGIFINRKNVILLLMCIELMLLAVNFNFVAFSRFLGDPRRPGLRVLHPDGRGGRGGDRARDPRRAVPPAPHHQRRGTRHHEGLSVDFATTCLLIVLAPLAAAAIAGLGGRFVGRAGAHTLCIAGVAVFIRGLRMGAHAAAGRRAGLQPGRLCLGRQRRPSRWRSAS